MSLPNHTHAVNLPWRTFLRGLLACALLASLAQSPLQSNAAPTANTWYVTVTGSDTQDCTSLASACRNIKTAISKAFAGDTINIGAGTYFDNLDVLFALTLQGAGADATIVDGSNLGSTITINLTGSSAPVNLIGLTLQHGQDSNGGGLWVSDGLVNLTNVNLRHNTASQGGAGIFNQGRMNLTDVVIDDNLNSGSDQGGGVLNLGQINLVNVTVSNNSATQGGGLGNRGTMTITTSLINGNLGASLGGGIINSQTGRLTLIDTTISNHLTGGGLRNTDNGVVVLSGGVITNNLTTANGGGIYNEGRLTLTGTGLYNNRATLGGGLSNQGTAALTNVTIQGNQVNSGSGGGLYSNGGSLILNGSLVSNNQTTNGNGGGLYVSGGTLTIANSQIMSNTTDLFGGGLYNSVTATLNSVDIIGNIANTSGGGIFVSTGGNLVYQIGLVRNNRTSGNGGGLNNIARADLRNLTISDNQANNGGGVFNDGVATIAANTLAANVAAYGGGLYNNISGKLTVTDNSLHDNFAQLFSGGGIDNRGQLLLGASSVYSNTSGTQGGSGLYNAGQARVFNSTLSYNRVISITNGGALLNNGGTLLITNTTLSANYGPSIVRSSGLVTITNSLVGAPIDGGSNCIGSVVSLGHNLESGTSCSFSASGDISGIDPQLGPLQFNGGSTPTRGLLTDSQAIDAAGTATCPATDQRGINRPQGSACDIGAYEVIGYSNAVTQTVGGQTCITSTLPITSSYLAADFLLGVNVTFEPRGDLRVNLYSPNNTQVNLLDNTGGVGKNLDVLWNQSAAVLVGTEDHEINTMFYKYERRPDHSLSPLFDQSLYGTWRLEICNVGDNVGTLNRWRIEVRTVGHPKIFLPRVRR